MGSLVFRIAAHLRSVSEVCIVIDQGRVVYPPAVCRLGADLDTTIVVHPARVQDALWAWEQSLRCGGVAVVIGWLFRLQEREFRRLQLAAEAGGGIGMLLRSARDRQQPSWADLRLLVSPRPPAALNSSRIVRERPLPRSRRLRVELLHSRGHFRTGTVLLDIDDETGAVHQVPRLAPAANPRRAAGA
jgi:protein ImuA